METLRLFLKKPTVRRVLVLAALCFVLFLAQKLLPLFLLSFIFIVLINGTQKFLYRYLHRFLPLNRSSIIVGLYVVLLGILIWVVWMSAPKILAESVDVVQTIASSVQGFLRTPSSGNVFIDYLRTLARNINVGQYATNGGKMIFNLLASIGSFGFNFVMALILSLFFMLQKGRIHAFFAAFCSSKLGWVFQDLGYFGREFTNTFGAVLQTQILISLINCVFSTIILSIMRLPNVLGLGMMIFMLGMIPVAGVFISLAPLSLIAYRVGGVRYIVYIVILIAILHALEGYVLNPKLMADKTKLPVFVTFVVLLISEHFLGIWGLLVGIPIFMFLLDIFGVNVSDISWKPLRASGRDAGDGTGGRPGGAAGEKGPPASHGGPERGA